MYGWGHERSGAVPPPLLQLRLPSRGPHCSLRRCRSCGLGEGGLIALRHCTPIAGTCPLLLPRVTNKKVTHQFRSQGGSAGRGMQLWGRALPCNDLGLNLPTERAPRGSRPCPPPARRGYQYPQGMPAPVRGNPGDPPASQGLATGSDGGRHWLPTAEAKAASMPPVALSSPDGHRQFGRSAVALRKVLDGFGPWLASGVRCPVT